MERVIINRQVFEKSQFDKTIDTNFTQLTSSLPPITSSLPTVDEFFSLYESLFFTIPKFGDLNSRALS